MATLVTTATCHHRRVRIASQRATQFIDLTALIEDAIRETGVCVGLVNIQSLHTTTAVVVNEHEPLLHTDFDDLLARAAPCESPYHHDDLDVRTVNVGPGERANGHAHCRALLLGTSVALNVAEGHLQLGRWQRVFLVELDGPQAREVSVLVQGDSGG